MRGPTEQRWVVWVKDTPVVLPQLEVIHCFPSRFKTTPGINVYSSFINVGIQTA